MVALTEAWLSGFRRPDRRAIYEWARAEVDLQGDYTPKGHFHVETSRYLIAPMEACLDPRVRMINILKSIQTGGTLIGDMLFYHALGNSPGPFMFTLQTDDDAEQHYLTRLEPTIDASPKLKPKLAAMHKKRDLYQFPEMNVYFQGANMNSLQRKSIRYEVNDEVWDWPAGMLGEAWGRTEKFLRSCKILNISQGGEEKSDWDDAYHQGRRHTWGVHCLACGHHQPLSFFARRIDNPRERAGIVWDECKLRDGRHDIPRAGASARFRCRKCGHDHPNEPRTWERFNANGAHLCLDPDKPVKNSSFHWESLVNGNWDALVEEFLRASEINDRGSPAALKKFYQKKLARMWALADSQQKVVVVTSGYAMEDPFEKGYKFAKIDEEARRWITADFQEGRAGDTRHFRVVCRAWRTDGSSRLLWYGRIDTPERLEQLRGLLGVSPVCVCVDGGHLGRTVAGWCARYGWTMLIGTPAKYFPHPPAKKGEKPRQLPFSRRYRTDPRIGKVGAGRSFAWTFDWSNPTVKPITANLRDGRGSKWEVPEDAPEEYRDGIHSEVLTHELDRKTAARKYFWKQIKENNHPWDCENMQTVGALIAQLIPFDDEAEDEEDEKPADETKPAAPGKPVAPHDQPEQLSLLPS